MSTRTNLLDDEIKRLCSIFLKKVEPYLRPDQLEWLLKCEVRYNWRLRTSLGRASFQDNWIEINPRLVKKYPQELAATLAHELAHIVAPLLYGRRGLGHGIGWQKTMAILGYRPERTHSLNVDEYKARHAVVAWAACACEEPHEIKKRRYMRMKYRRYRYQCLKCGQILKLLKHFPSTTDVIVDKQAR